MAVARRTEAALRPALVFDSVSVSELVFGTLEIKSRCWIVALPSRATTEGDAVAMAGEKPISISSGFSDGEAPSRYPPLSLNSGLLRSVMLFYAPGSRVSMELIS